jgi:hypothetical protein
LGRTVESIERRFTRILALTDEMLDQTFREALRVLRAGGGLFCSMPHSNMNGGISGGLRESLFFGID